MTSKPAAGPEPTLPDVVIWHDVECGAYSADLELWRELAQVHPGPVLDLGAGTGRVALDLARHGHRVTALDLDAQLVAVLRDRAAGLELEAVVGDAREFELDRRFSLVVMPMQTVQLLDGAPGRQRFLACARRHLLPTGLLAVAITEELPSYEVESGNPAVIPDMAERDGVVYSSQPTAIRRRRDGFLLVRRRERISPDGHHDAQIDEVALSGVSAAQLEGEGMQAGLRLAGRRTIAPTSDHVGSVVVMFRV
jgi:SAM-dependent methyltransferase